MTNSKLQIIGPCSIKRNLYDCNIPTLLVDGALNHNLDNNSEIFYSIGDNDSNQSTKQIHIPYPSDKDQTDFELALVWAQSHKYKELYIHGFFAGPRLDHQLSVVCNLLKHCENYRSIDMYCDQHYMKFYPKGIHEINYTGKFSLFAITENRISISGDLKYPVQNQTLSIGEGKYLSNQSYGNIKVQTDASLAIYFFEE